MGRNVLLGSWKLQSDVTTNDVIDEKIKKKRTIKQNQKEKEKTDVA